MRGFARQRPKSLALLIAQTPASDGAKDINCLKVIYRCPEPDFVSCVRLTFGGNLRMTHPLFLSQHFLVCKGGLCNIRRGFQPHGGVGTEPLDRSQTAFRSGIARE